MAGRDRHQIKEIEALLQEAEANGFRVEHGDRGRPFKVKCPCADKDMVIVHRTPSGQTYPNRKRRELEKLPCWRKSP